MATSPLFWKWMHKNYVASPVADQAAYERKLAQTQERLKPDWDLLEIGCGSGNTALAHAPFVRSVLATDFCDPMMDHGRKRAADEGVDNITFACKRLEEISAPPHYDAVLMLNVLHLIKDWRGAIARAAELTRPGGIVVTSSFAGKDGSMGFRVMSGVFRLLPLVPFLAIFSTDELLAEMAKHGLTPEENWSHGNGAARFVIARKTG